ncbi:hypothetical protein [Acinetobacter sp. AS23]|nr:hypothetical protein [Acinetobacter sp. AS23]URM42823.1 hypothetical protein K6I41_12215 [Acinetobacter sp. AS23]
MQLFFAQQKNQYLHLSKTYEAAHVNENALYYIQNHDQNNDYLL